MIGTANNSSANVEELFSAGRLLLEQGQPILPCNGKVPCGDDGRAATAWQTTPFTAERLLAGLQGADDPAIGMIMGPRSRTVDIETDSPGEVEAAEHLFRDCEPLPTVVYTSLRGQHNHYKYDARLEPINKATFEFKAPGGNSVKIRLGLGDKASQSIIPPSRGRAWLPGHSPDECNVEALPEIVIERLLAAASAASNGKPRQPDAVGVHRACLAAMMVATKNLPEPGHAESDGSKRAWVACRRLAEFGLSDQQALDTFRAYEAARPFPVQYTDKRILDNLRASEKMDGLGGEVKHQDDLPTLLIPGGSRTVSQVANELGVLLAKNQMHYMRGGDVSFIQQNKKGELSIRPVKPARFVSDSERVVRWLKPVKDKPPVEVNLTKTAAEMLLHAQTFQDVLPELLMISPCPVLAEENGKLVEVVGFHEPSGVYAQGEPTWEMPLDEAISTVCELLDGTKFTTKYDESRALSTLITPAMVAGGLLGGRAPMDIYEADDSQAGKSFMARVKAAVYRQIVRSVTQAKQGVKTLEGSLDAAMSDGKQFISLDNVRGKIDIPALESLLTEDSYNTRSAYRGEVPVDPRRVCISLTSNSAEITRDLANRACFVSIRKRPPEFRFRPYLEGDILAHVRANQPKFLSAIFAVVRAWHAAGKPRTRETGHDFRAWCQSLDWIVQELFKARPLMGKHKEAQRRVSNPALVWLRNVALAVQRQKRLGDRMQTNELTTIIADDGYQVEIPGLDEGEDMSDDATSKRAWQAMGKRLGSCFRNDSRLEIEQFTIDREQVDDGGYRPWLYAFTTNGESR